MTKSYEACIDIYMNYHISEVCKLPIVVKEQHKEDAEMLNL